MTAAELAALLDDHSKSIVGDISWSDDEDHSPTKEFRVEVDSASGYPLFVRGSYNTAAGRLTYVLVHKSVGPLYRIDFGHDHHNPSCNYVGDQHVHKWTEEWGDKQAESLQSITSVPAGAATAWAEFCTSTGISHRGGMPEPPHEQLELF